MRVEIPNQITVTIGGLISRGVKAVEVTDAGKLIFTLTDGSVIDLGSVMGPQGPKGETGATGPQGPAGPVNVPSTTSLIKGNGSGGLVAATRGIDYIASGNIVKQTLVATETTPTENYAINWVYG